MQGLNIPGKLVLVGALGQLTSDGESEGESDVLPILSIIGEIILSRGVLEDFWS